jgi:arsenical pump membrane protein
VVARAEGLFEFGGGLIARVGRSGPALMLSTSILVVVVTVTLNLDTSVTFLTPVVLAAARRQRRDPEPFMYLVVAMSNGASLLLPGSNLTNLIVLQETHGSGAAFVTRTAGPWAASVVAVMATVAVLYRRRATRTEPGQPQRPPPTRLGVGALGVIVAVGAMLTLPANISALVVFGVGAALVVMHSGIGRPARTVVARALNIPLLFGLFGAACALGTLGRTWDGPAHLLAHLGVWQTAGVGAGTAIVANNLPAARY